MNTKVENRGASVAHVDVLIVGAGISGIGSAYHLQQQCPNKSYVILETKDTFGGTWDLTRAARSNLSLQGNAFGQKRFVRR